MKPVFEENWQREQSSPLTTEQRYEVLRGRAVWHAVQQAWVITVPTNGGGVGFETAVDKLGGAVDQPRYSGADYPDLIKTGKRLEF